MGLSDLEAGGTRERSLPAKQVAERLCLHAAQKDLEARRAKNRSFGSAQDRLGGGVPSEYVDTR